MMATESDQKTMPLGGEKPLMDRYAFDSKKGFLVTTYSHVIVPVVALEKLGKHRKAENGGARGFIYPFVSDTYAVYLPATEYSANRQCVRPKVNLKTRI